MSGGFTGTSEEFAKAHSNVQEAKQAMDKEINQLKGNIEQTQQGWQSGGEGGAVAFQNMMQKYDEKARACTAVLDEIGEMLQQSGIEYQRAEEETADQVSQITAALDG